MYKFPAFLGASFRDIYRRVYGCQLQVRTAENILAKKSNHNDDNGAEEVGTKNTNRISCGTVQHKGKGDLESKSVKWNQLSPPKCTIIHALLI